MASWWSGWTRDTENHGSRAWNEIQIDIQDRGIRDLLEKDFETRKRYSDRIHRDFPGRIPCILLRHSRDCPLFPKPKVLCPSDMTFGQMLLNDGLSMSLEHRAGLIYMAGNSMIAMCMTLSEVYERHRSPDGFLYIVYTQESTFG